MSTFSLRGKPLLDLEMLTNWLIPELVAEGGGLAYCCPQISERAPAKQMDWLRWTKLLGGSACGPKITGLKRL